jgi:hypothetical protein
MTQIASQTITPASGTLVGEYSTVSLSSAVNFTSTGGVYVLSASVDEGKNAFVEQSGVSTLAAIGSGFAGRWDSTEGVFPSNTAGSNFAYIGPNADITAVAVPEPSAMGMICLVGLFAAGRRWKKNITLA